MLASARRARAEIESEILEQVGSHHVQAAKVALVALLGVAGLDERVATRTVPTPDP
jgi:hypothetical protein